MVEREGTQYAVGMLRGCAGVLKGSDLFGRQRGVHRGK